MQRGQVHAFHVHGIDLVELRLGDIEIRLLSMGPARVVDDDVELAESCARRLNQPGPVRGPGDVGLDEFALDRSGYALAALGVDIGDQHLCALLRESARNALAEPRARSGDDRNLVLQPHPASGYFLNGLCSHNSSTYRATRVPSRSRNCSTAVANCGCASQCAESASTGISPRNSLCSPCAPPSKEPSPRAMAHPNAWE